MNMLTNAKNKLKNRKGFTLVEMIIVMVIMALLVVALVPTMMGFIQDAKDKKNLSVARAYYVAAQSVATELSATEASLGTTDAAALITIKAALRWAELTGGLKGGELTNITVTGFTVDSVTYNPAKAGDKNVVITGGDKVEFTTAP